MCKVEENIFRIVTPLSTPLRISWLKETNGLPSANTASSLRAGRLIARETSAGRFRDRAKVSKVDDLSHVVTSWSTQALSGTHLYS